MNIGGSRLLDLQMLGQSVWLECNHPRTLARSTLTHLIRAGISGIDTNPSSLAAAYADDAAYHEPAGRLRAAGATMREIIERLRAEDALRLADRLRRRVYDCTGGLEGYANVDVSAVVANDAAGIETEARRLWSAINRPNLMIKVPATDAGLVAIRRCIAAGLNINATGIFGARRYAAVIDAYLSGLQDRVAAGLPLEGVTSVASIMIGRIDDRRRRTRCDRKTPAGSARNAATPPSGGGGRAVRIPALQECARLAALAIAGRTPCAEAAFAVGRHHDRRWQ
jgi:transaldolase